MKVIVCAFALILLCNVSLQTTFLEQWIEDNFGVKPLTDPTEGKNLVWADEFDSEDTVAELDPKYWTREVVTGATTGNNEWEYYTDRMDNSFAQNGNLVIEAKQEAYLGFDYTSAKLTSNLSWTYGYFEARAKVPKGEGFWPAIWMLPRYEAAQAKYGPWPAEGEIDIMESINSVASFPNACQTLHFGGWMHDASGAKKWDNQQAPAQPANCFAIDNWDEFHTWGVDWSPEGMDFYVDGKKTVSVASSEWYSWDYAKNEHYPSPAPFDEPFKWIINFAVAGAWPGYNVDNTQLPAQFQVDYVRVYQ